MLRDPYNEPDLDVGAVEDHLEVSYEQTTWAVGGTGL
jgi:hypothetical protein